MEERNVEMYEDLFSVYTKLVSTARWAKAELQKRQNDPEYCTDVAYAFREMDKLLKDIGVEVRKIQDLAEQVACITWVRSQAETGPIHTEYVTATPDVKMQPKMPKRNSPEEAALLEWLGMTKNHDSVRIHWPTLCDIVTQRVAESENLPPGIKADELHSPKAKLIMRKKRNISDNL